MKIHKYPAPTPNSPATLEVNGFPLHFSADAIGNLSVFAVDGGLALETVSVVGDDMDFSENDWEHVLSTTTALGATWHLLKARA